MFIRKFVDSYIHVMVTAITGQVIVQEFNIADGIVYQCYCHRFPPGCRYILHGDRRTAIMKGMQSVRRCNGRTLWFINTPDLILYHKFFICQIRKTVKNWGFQ